jgi:hypothetical protein
MVAVAMQPAQASCPPPGALINSGAAVLISNPAWCGGNGCYDTPATSPRLSGFFWGQTGANGARNAGVDSGSFLIQSWTQKPDGNPSDNYYYRTYLADPVYGTPFSWDGGGIDGCIGDITPAVNFDECTCLLLTDSWNGQGYFALLSVKSDAQGNFHFPTAAAGVNTPVVFAPIPRPVVTDSSRNTATGQVTFTVDVPTPTAGTEFADPNCGCNFGFRVYAQVMGEGGMVPADRRACTQDTLFEATGQSIAPNATNFNAACKAAGFGWVPASAAGGTATQNLTPFGATRTASTVTVNCGDPAMGFDVYLAAALGTNEGPGGINFNNVSTNSFQVKCGNYQLAEPSRPRSPEAPGQSGTPRGRERGGRER